jgi:hypothetical protein
MVFAIEKPCVLVVTLLSLKIGVYHPYDLVLGGVGALSCIFVYFVFLLHFLHTHLSYFLLHLLY